jgi:RND superfamily putative drug exporter
VFNWGLGASALGLTGTGPIDASIPVLLFSVLFGLSTDYEVYLASRIQEEWQSGRRYPTTPDGQTRRNHHAIVFGQAKAGRIVATAALIMVLVFGSFLLSGNRVLQEFGFGLGFAVLIDAFFIRMALVPAVMHRIGSRNWDLPTWLDRTLPNLSIEASDQPADQPEIDPRPTEPLGVG